MKSPLLPTIHLIGDPQENFYRLGRKDRENYKEFIENLEGLLRTPWKGVDNGLHKLSERLLRHNDPAFKKHLTAYAEGLETSYEKLATAFLIPELLVSFNRWLPILSRQLVACSSVFMLDEKSQSPIHLRLLDFPFLGIFDKNERILITEFKNEQRIISFGSAGFPYPTLSCMNESGVSLALHQKFTQEINYKGTPIWELTRELMASVRTPEEVLSFFKGKESISGWGLYMLFKNNEVLAVDLLGKKLVSKRFELKKNKPLCFNNLLIENPEIQREMAPYHFYDYCEERLLSLKKKIKGLKEQREKELLKTIATPTLSEGKPFKLWKADALTPITLSAVTMNPKNQSALLIPGEAPKFYEGELISFHPEKGQKLLKEKTENFPPPIKEGLKRLVLGVQAYHEHKEHQAYHQTQMAAELLKGQAEEKLARLFFCFYRYLHEEGSALREDILRELRGLEKDLPPYLKDQCKLFIWRLERLLKKKTLITERSFKFKENKKIFALEKKIPLILLYQMTRSVLAPRPEIQDVLYNSFLRP